MALDVANAIPCLLDLDGKVVSFHVRDSKGSLKIHSPKWHEAAGRTLLRGEWAEPQEGSSSFFHGTTVFVAWDSVVDFVVFESLEDYQHRCLAEEMTGAGRPQ